MELEAVLGQIKEKFKNKDPFWAYPLAAELGRQDPALPIKWAVIVLKKLLPKLYPQGHPRAQKLMDDFPAELSDKNPNFYMRKCEEVWYSYPPRDEIITAISDIYGSIANKIAGYDRTFYMCIAGALGNMSDHRLFSSELLDLVFETFKDCSVDPNINSAS